MTANPAIALVGTGIFAHNLHQVLNGGGCAVAYFVDEFRTEDFMGKPVDAKRLERSLERAAAKVALQRELEMLRRKRYGDLDWVVMKALEKERSRRYETANGLAADVGRFLRDEPIEARPANALYRFGRLYLNR